MAPFGVFSSIIFLHFFLASKNCLNSSVGIMTPKALSIADPVWDDSIVFSAWGSPEETPAFQVFQDAFRQVIPIASDGGKPNRIVGSPDVLRSLLQKAGFTDIQIVGPVSHEVHVASPQEFYDRFALTSPKIKGFLNAMTPEEREAVKDKVMTLADERGGGRDDGSIAIPSRAYFAYGTKRATNLS